MSIGDVRVLENGHSERVVSETPIKNYCQETPEQEKVRIKKGLPAPMYGYIAVKTEIGTSDKVKPSREKEAKDLLKLADDKRRAYYERVLPSIGKQGVEELIKEVKKQRRLQNSKEMSL